MAVTISIEIELAWGVHDIDDRAHLSEDGVPERRALTRLLEHCDRVGVPISFDVVGHLMETSCDGDHDGPHRDGWFDADPGTDAADAPLFYAPDAVREVVERSAGHELCTHTYSHVVCGDASPETVAWELTESQSLIRSETGAETVSIVPPRHSRPPGAALREGGIECMRMSRDTSDRSNAARLKELLYGPHPVYEPELVDGIVETYCTTYPSLTSSTLPSGQRPAPAPFRVLPVELKQRLHEQYLSRALDAAVEREGDCHLWCHLYDLANEYQWPPVRAFLDELAVRRDRGELDVRTMAELNADVRAVQSR